MRTIVCTTAKLGYIFLMAKLSFAMDFNDKKRKGVDSTDNIVENYYNSKRVNATILNDNHEIEYFKSDDGSEDTISLYRIKKDSGEDWIGYIEFSHSNDIGKIEMIRIRKKYKKKGYAARLINDAVCLFRHLKCKTIKLYVKDRINNEAAVNLYTKIGFEKDKDFEDNGYMHLFLN
jgi:ribosomal protein S18 acetylase RimI-like enzyme